MENLEIKGHKGEYYIPSVSFDAESGICELSGESYVESSEQFYAPLLQWLNDYFEQINKPITFNIRLIYFNTSSAKRILEILKVLKAYEGNGGKVTVNWYCEDADEMADEVEDYQIVSKLDINLIVDENMI